MLRLLCESADVVPAFTAGVDAGIAPFEVGAVMGSYRDAVPRSDAIKGSRTRREV